MNVLSIKEELRLEEIKRMVAIFNADLLDGEGK